MKNINGWTSPYAELDSFFNHASYEVLAQYRARGINKDDLVYTKEFRDLNPCRYIENANNPGQLNDFEHPEDWVKIN